MGRLRVTPTKKSTSKKTLSPQETFAKLWQQVQNEQLLLGQLPDQIQQFYTLYNDCCGRLEAQWCELQRDEMTLLLAHWPRKSLRERDRMILIRYIISAFNDLMNNPFRSFSLDALQQTITQTLRPEETVSEEEQEALFHDESADGQDTDSTARNSAEGNTEHFFEDDEFDQFFKQQNHEYQTPNDTASELFNATTLNKMFRQLSKVLHPDLEQDEEQKKLKHELMSQLLTARDKQDLGTIVGLYSQYIGDGGAQFSAEDYPRLTLLLKKQLRDLQSEKQQLAMESGLPGMVYHFHHHKNPTRQKNLLRERTAILKRACEDVEQSLTANTTVKNLKRFLEYWADEHMARMFFDFEEL